MDLLVNVMASKKSLGVVRKVYNTKERAKAQTEGDLEIIGQKNTVTCVKD